MPAATKPDKKPTFAEVVKKRKDAVASSIEHQPTMTISGCGLQGTGKSLWGLRYLPPPILHLNFDRNTDSLYYAKDKEGKLLIPEARRDQIVPIQLGPEDFDVEEAASWTELTARMAKEKLEKALADYLPAMPGGTVILDGGAVYNNLIQLIELSAIRRVREGKDQKLFPFDYANVNSYWNGFLGKLDRANVNFYITHHLAEDWGADGPIGTFHAQNNSQVPRMVQIELWFWCLCGGVVNAEAIKAEKDKKKPAPVYCRKAKCTSAGHQGTIFHTKVRENKLAKQMVGFGMDDLSFPTLYQMTFGTPYKGGSK